jgi:phage FluMu protein Com
VVSDGNNKRMGEKEVEVMGMFDSVFVSCPNCGHVVEFQSKAGACNLSAYTVDNVPLKILADIDGESKVCPKCQHVIRVTVRPVGWKVGVE